MAEQVRVEHRAVIRGNQFISVAVDDKGLRRLIKWKADDSSAPKGARSGILASFVVDRDLEMQLEEHELDYA